VSRTKAPGKRQRPAVVALVHTARGEKPRARMIIEVQVETKKGVFKIKALIDLRAEANYI
jgi:hypothetical protein